MTRYVAYLSLYRKYRSQTFEEVSGQDHVTRTLQNAVRSGRIAHAYLLCGPRGTGKTTTARLLAKALNCELGPDPTPTPCNTCAACVQINEGRFLDMKEIDAASNRGIDEIRQLRDNVAYAAATGRYKVYVIDEAHQITGDGFNALLKTLEEPPPHVVFILATTEAHKIPATILSRCQRFDFRRASLSQLRERVAFVAASEGAAVENGALDLIAREANGGWRDALSLLEQVLAFCDGAVTARDVYTVLGTVEAETLLTLADRIHAADGGELFRLLDELIAEGKDPRQLLSDLTAHYRVLMLTASGSPVAGEPELAPRMAVQAQKYGQGRLIEAIQVLAQAEREARWSEQPRLLVELAVVRLMCPRGQTGAAPPVSRSAPRAAEAPVSRSTQGSAPPAAELPPPPLTVGDARQGREDDNADLSLFEVPRRTPRQPDPLPDRPPPGEGIVSAQPASPNAQRPTPNAQAPTPSPDLELLRRKWRLIREELKRDKKMTVYAFIADTEPVRYEYGELVIRFPSRTMTEEFARRGKEFAEPLALAIERVTGFVCRVRAEAGAGKVAPAPARTAPAAPAPRPAAATVGKPSANPDEVLHNVVEIFDGQLLDPEA